MQHLHPEDFEADAQLAGTTHFPIWLTFPAPGLWTFHISVDLLPPGGGAPSTVARQQTLRVGAPAVAPRSNDSVSPSAATMSDATQPVLTAVLPEPGHKGATQQGLDAMATLPAERAVPGAMTVAVELPPGGVYEHECSRIVFTFSDAETRQPVDGLLPWLHPSMHVLDVSVSGSTNDTLSGSALLLAESHGVPEALDKAVIGSDQQHGLDLCNLEMEQVPTAAAATGGKAFGPRMVWYARFAGARTHHVFVQVRLRPAEALESVWPSVHGVRRA